MDLYSLGRVTELLLQYLMINFVYNTDYRELHPTYRQSVQGDGTVPASAAQGHQQM